MTDQPLIELRDVAYHAGGRDILHDITLTIRRNQILTIVGPNGAGKSTLLALILGHLAPTAYLPQKTAQNRLRAAKIPSAA